MPMVNGKKYPYTKQGKAAAAAAKAAKVKKAEGGMLSKVKNTQNEDIKDASDAKPAFRTPLPFMCGGGAYKTNSSGKPKKSKSRMRKAEGGPVMKGTPVKERDNPEQEDMRYNRNRNNNGNGNGRKN